MGGRRGAYRGLRERDNLEDLVMRGMILLKWVLVVIGGMDWIDLERTVTASQEGLCCMELSVTDRVRTTGDL
jgi:hypothetical protein